MKNERKATAITPERRTLEDKVVTLYFNRVPMSVIARRLSVEGIATSESTVQTICKKYRT